MDDPHHGRGEIHCREHGDWSIVLPFELDEHPDLGQRLPREQG